MKAVRYTAYALLVAVLVAIGGAGVMWQQGYRVYAVQTGSMAPTFPTGSLVVDAPATRELPAVGTVITFRTDGGLVTHRVEGIAPDGVYTQGDANPAPDAWTVQPQNIVGQVTRGFAGAGYVLVFLQQPTGVPSLVLLALSVVFAWTIFFPSTPLPVRRARHRLAAA